MAYMEVLLSEDIDNLGHRGQVVRVRAGYGRNYLLPQKLAIEASPGNKRMIEEQKRVLGKREKRERGSAEEQRVKLEGVEVSFDRRVGEHGILYGSVTILDIVEGLKKLGYEIERRRIVLKEPIKSIGEHDVVVKLHRDVTPTIKVIVHKEGAAEAKAAPAEAKAAAPEVAVEQAADTEVDKPETDDVAESSGE
jgi:large subunit ribosomal protein L9